MNQEEKFLTCLFLENAEDLAGASRLFCSLINWSFRFSVSVIVEMFIPWSLLLYKSMLMLMAVFCLPLTTLLINIPSDRQNSFNKSSNNKRFIFISD